MARQKKRTPDFANNPSALPVSPLSVKKQGGAIVPPVDERMDAYRFTTKIRYGRFSAEVFCKNPDRRKELGLRPLPVMED